MDDEATHLTPGEVRRIIGRLRGPDVVRLGALARVWASGLRQHDADDLLNEALDRVLSGRRPWPIEVSLPAFLSQVMRSIASQWRQEARREPLKEDETGEMVEEESHNPGACYEMGDLIARMRRALGTDPPALGVFEHILADSDREDAQAALAMTATQYDTMTRRAGEWCASCSKPFTQDGIMSPNVTDDRALALLAEGVLDASPEEIVRVAVANGIDVTAVGTDQLHDRRDRGPALRPEADRRGHLDHAKQPRDALRRVHRRPHGDALRESAAAGQHRAGGDRRERQRAERAADRAAARRSQPCQPLFPPGRPHRLHPLSVSSGPEVHPGRSAAASGRR